MKRQPKFEVYPAADGYRWRLKAANGKIVAIGEAYWRKADAVRSARAVLTAITGATLVVLP